MTNPAAIPVVIEAAITPLRWGVPAQTADQMAAESLACIAAGASIVHHHHDMRLTPEASAEQCIAVGRRVLAAHPGTLVYTDYLTGRTAKEEHAHLQPMAQAGVLTMFAIDPGITAFPSDDRDGLPTRTYTDGLTFAEAHEMAQLARATDVPLSLGVFEPGQLRWIVHYAQRYGFSAGSIVKLYFGGHHRVDRDKEPGLNFGLPATPQALDVYLSMMAGCTLPFVVSLFGDALLDSPLARYALEKGGHLRVGIEDAAGMSDLTNAQMVAAAAALAREVGRPVVPAGQARAVLAQPRQ